MAEYDIKNLIETHAEQIFIEPQKPSKFKEITYKKLEFNIAAFEQKLLSLIGGFIFSTVSFFLPIPLIICYIITALSLAFIVYIFTSLLCWKNEKKTVQKDADAYSVEMLEYEDNLRTYNILLQSYQAEKDTKLMTYDIINSKQDAERVVIASQPQPETTIPKTPIDIITNQSKQTQIEIPSTIIDSPTTTKPNEIIFSEKIKEEKINVSESKDVFINYEFSINEISNSYPILRCPRKGTIVRSYDKGKRKRRGFKEESFQSDIQAYFGKDYTVLGNVKLNIAEGTRPYEPDIAIVDKLSTGDIRIDIEIDEPYAGVTRQATHCQGEDIIRDIYFTDRGWIVLRFSEYQVHLFKNKCLLFIAHVIKSAVPHYKIPAQLINQPSLQTEDLWDIIQAQKWEKAKYREEYLNHNFPNTEDKLEEIIERGLNKQEIREESFVKSTIIDLGKEICEIIHPRDIRIKFISEGHIYLIDKAPAKSATTIIENFFPAFDTEKWARIKAIERLELSNQELTESNIEREANSIAKEWLDRGKKAAEEGTFLHKQIENFYRGKDYQETDAFHLFKKFHNNHSTLKPYRMEWRIFDEEHRIAGTIDLISKNGIGYELYDWKRSKKVVDSFGEPIKINRRSCGVGELSDIHDTSYNRYCLQQSLYKYILDKNYGITVSKMFLVVLHPDYANYHKIEVPYLKEKVEYILSTL